MKALQRIHSPTVSSWFRGVTIAPDINHPHHHCLLRRREYKANILSPALPECLSSPHFFVTIQNVKLLKHRSSGSELDVLNPSQQPVLCAFKLFRVAREVGICFIFTLSFIIFFFLSYSVPISPHGHAYGLIQLSKSPSSIENFALGLLKHRSVCWDPLLQAS